MCGGGGGGGGGLQIIVLLPIYLRIRVKNKM